MDIFRRGSIRPSLKSEAYPADSDAYRPGTEHQHGWNLFHINALYDLENGIYTDVIVQKEHTKHESKALCRMAERSKIDGPVILLADRNYEAYNSFACLEKKGWKYLIRLKDRARKNAYGLKLSDRPEFDLPVRMTLGRLSSSAILVSALQALYAKRWGIETSFRELKYTVGLIHLHSRKPDLVFQEIFAAFTIFNFTQAAAWNVDEGWGRSKYERRVNFSHAVYLCCEALRGKAGEIAGLLERTLRPCRPNCSYPRPKISGNRISPMYISAR